MSEPLLEAVEAGDHDAVRRLVAGGEDVNQRSGHGVSVLFDACMIADTDMVRLLLELGADPNFRAEGDAEMWYAPTAFDLVSQAQALLDWQRYLPVREVLLSHGAKNHLGEIPTAEAEEGRTDRVLANQEARRHPVNASDP